MNARGKRSPDICYALAQLMSSLAFFTSSDEPPTPVGSHEIDPKYIMDTEPNISEQFGEPGGRNNEITRRINVKINTVKL